ncbi:hypothetical protein [Streptomyces sp. NPDC059452]|uniref:hypothetical protein n=1 Tax=Streptomyces sp. NPDC059452 TaxID=3346835 RepID=UPI00369B8F83
MSAVAVRLPKAQFAAGARKAIASLSDAFLRDEDLANDLDQILGAPAGPVGLAGRRSRRRCGLLRSATSRPSDEEAAELSRAVTRLDRMLERLVAIAEFREWEPPYPSVQAAIVQAKAVRGQQPQVVGGFETDRAHLRLMAMAASDILARLIDDEERVMSLPRTYWCHAALEASTPGASRTEGCTKASAEAAVDWVRESVRQVSPRLDRSTFHRVWGWLGDHRAVRAAVIALRQSEPYNFSIDIPAGRLVWTVHHVGQLPLASPCGCRPFSCYSSLSTPPRLGAPPAGSARLPMPSTVIGAS